MVLIFNMQKSVFNYELAKVYVTKGNRRRRWPLRSYKENTFEPLFWSRSTGTLRLPSFRSNVMLHTVYPNSFFPVRRVLTLTIILHQVVYYFKYEKYGNLELSIECNNKEKILK